VAVSEQTFAIVGANLAGGRAAEALRERGFDGRIVLIGVEPDRPYERPPLSKPAFTRGETPPEKVYLRPPEYYLERGIELRLGGRAVALDPRARSVLIEGGDELRYDKLLIATGTGVRRLAVPGVDRPGVHYLRTIRDAEAIGAELARAQRVVVIGAGFIGAEMAATARVLGRDVTLLEMLPVPLGRALGTDMGQLCAAIHRDHGTDLRCGVQIEALRGDGRVEEVVLGDGSTVECDLCVVGVGVAPNVAWLAGSGVEVENGVVVNERCETSVPDVYAAGDVASWPNPLLGERLRVEHYDNAQNQGIHAAAAMLGGDEVYAPVPYFWSDQYELTMQYVGHARGGERLAIRGDLAGRSFTAFYLDGERVRAAFVVGRPREMLPTRRIIQAGKAVDEAALVDESTDLRALARALAEG
jgi:3-phenylpropionate/trans-cinnamate dioxygenase ferredoxin reductase subunit